MSKLLTYGIIQQKRANNPDVAFSVRKVINSYSGYCIKVRRSSDNATQDIGFSSGALDESSLSSFVGSDNGFIHTWYDQSKNSNNLTNTDNATQPKIVTSGTILKDNNKPAIKFESSLFLTLTSNISCNSDSSSFIVCNRSAGSSLIALCVATTGVGNGPYTLYQYGDTCYLCSSKMSSWVGISTIRQYLFSFIAIDDVNYLYANGTSKSLSNGAVDMSMYTLHYMGRRGSEYGNGYIQEQILYLNDQRDNRTTIESAINSYYSIY